MRDDLLTQWAEQAVTRAHPDVQIMSSGDSYSGDAEDVLDARTVTVDQQPGGEEVLVAVYEAIFMKDGTGFIQELATTWGDASFEQWDFTHGFH